MYIDQVSFQYIPGVIQCCALSFQLIVLICHIHGPKKKLLALLHLGVMGINHV